MEAPVTTGAKGFFFQSKIIITTNTISSFTVPISISFFAFSLQLRPKMFLLHDYGGIISFRIA